MTIRLNNNSSIFTSNSSFNISPFILNNDNNGTWAYNSRDDRFAFNNISVITNNNTKSIEEIE